MAFLLDSLKQKFSKDQEEEKGFSDMNYLIGNTSGMDIGQDVPSPLDQRIGRMAQIGGEIMEVQITNPATFQIDRPELFNVINQLDLDITLHGDPNIGFAGAYATRSQGAAGYNIVHRYFHRYIDQLAAFKYEVQQRDDLDFEVGYVNMHASNETIPPMEERLASDISVDPFGEQTIDIADRGKQFNIFRNEEFMENMFDYWFLEVIEQPWQYYRQVFSDKSEDFRREWRDAREEIADSHYTGDLVQDVEDKVGLIQTAQQVDQGVETTFLDYCGEAEFSPFTIDQQTVRGGSRTITISTLADLQDIGRRGLFSQIRMLSRDLHRIRSGNVESEEITQNAGKIEAALNDVIDRLWGMNGHDTDLSVEAKESALTRNYDIERSQIFEQAEDKAEDAAREAFAHEDWDVRREILENLASGRPRDEFLKESAIFLRIMPAWMQTADASYGEKHPGWDAPKFIWEAIVDDTFDGYEEYQEYLNESRENVLNVLAAVGCCYIWGHFTQNPNKFTQDAFKTNGFEPPELKDGDEGIYTWVEWMNKFELKINLEAMFGDPGQLRRVWRPKDIAVACRAINKTAEKQSEDWAEEYKGAIAKFTIDMEHTSSYGVDPFREIETLIEQEKEMAKEGKTGANPEKPLADIIKTYHLTKPGWEQQSGHRHGPFARGDATLYKWLYRLVENGFARNPEEKGIVMFEVGGEYREEMYVIRVAMDMIQRGITPDDLDPDRVPLEGNYENVEQELLGRFFGMDRPNFNREWAKIEEHAFDPLKGLLETTEFDHTWSSRAAIERDNRPAEWKEEEYK